jgi:hypothetical protein
MTQLPWIIMLLENMLQIWTIMIHNVLLLPCELMFTKVLRKKKPNVALIVNFLITYFHTKKLKPVLGQFLENLVSYITKGYHSLIVAKNIKLKWHVLSMWASFFFITHQFINNGVILNIVNKTMEHHILTSLKPPWLLQHLTCECIMEDLILLH